MFSLTKFELPSYLFPTSSEVTNFVFSLPSQFCKWYCAYTLATLSPAGLPFVDVPSFERVEIMLLVFMAFNPESVFATSDV